MKSALSSSEWGCVFGRLAVATHAMAEIASLLDTSAGTDNVADDAMRIEMDLNILESRLHKLRTSASATPEAA